MASATPITDHDEIREWVESRGGRPACVKGTAALLRIDFGKPDEKLQEIDWDQWFDTFDSRRLAALIQERGRSRFIKLVDRRNAAGRGRSNSRAARASGGRSSAASRPGSATRGSSTSRSTRTSGAASKRTSASRSAGKTSKSGRTASSTRSTKATASARARTSSARDTSRSSTTGRKRATKKR